jgi:histidine triad (HIT) family protein
VKAKSTSVSGDLRVPTRLAGANQTRYSGAMTDCLFCRISSGEARADRVYEDDRAVAFRDINPAGPTHILVIPRKHIPTLADLKPEDDALVGHLHRVATEVAHADGRTDFRLTVNCGAGAGQSVFHLHLHVIGGRALAWPPG